jgi:uncharacterized protein (TIGR04551 family)
MRRFSLHRSPPVPLVILLARRAARVSRAPRVALCQIALLAASFALASVRASAQDAAVASAADAGAPAPVADAATAASEEPAEPAEPTEPEREEGAAPATGPVLEPPALTPLALDADAGAPAAEAKPAAKPPAKKGWTASETVFHLHGYLRARAGLLKDGALGRIPAGDRLPYYTDNGVQRMRNNYDPFIRFISTDSRAVDKETGELFPATAGSVGDQPVDRGCGDSASNVPGRCKKTTQIGGDMRLRLKPEIHLSDDIRIKTWIDVLDNVGLGTQGYGPNDNGPSEFDLRSAIRVRRAWGEARNRDIGELRFGRMGADWGLGMLDNGGDRNGIDSDFSTDLDRLMGMTNLGGFYFMASYDWAKQGKLLGASLSPSGVPIDQAQRDDMSAVTSAIAHRLDPEVQRSTLARGEAVFNYGVYFVWRKQLLKNRVNEDDGDFPFRRINQKQYIPDLWAQFLWEGLRVELEAAFVAGRMDGGCPRLDVNPDNRTAAVATASEVFEIGSGSDNSKRTNAGYCKFRKFGVALEMEYRLLDDRLGIHFLSGLASGDKQAYGLAYTNNADYQRATENSGDRTVSTFEFHPDYRVDLILWRTLMRRVAGAYYFKPGVSYDFVHDPYGQVAGARIDAIYSRAMSAQQTWGRSANLGLELDVSLYYRSEDGPDLWDGFYTTVQWGILFPFKGLGYPGSYANENKHGNANAMIFRAVMGIAF